MKAIYTGSFNPITIGHLIVAQTILNELDIEEIIFVPVSDNYNKKGLNNKVTAEDRCNMIKLSINDNERLSLNTIEVDKIDRQLKTIETLELLKDKEDLFLIIGSDNLPYISGWYRGEDILSKFKLIVVERGEESIDDIISNNVILSKYKENIYPIKTVNTSISSSLVRNNIIKNKSIKYLVNENIIDYIKENNLYK